MQLRFNMMHPCVFFTLGILAIKLPKYTPKVFERYKGKIVLSKSERLKLEGGGDNYLSAVNSLKEKILRRKLFKEG